jgi:hypothetical protein
MFNRIIYEGNAFHHDILHIVRNIMYDLHNRLSDIFQSFCLHRHVIRFNTVRATKGNSFNDDQAMKLVYKIITTY